MKNNDEKNDTFDFHSLQKMIAEVEQRRSYFNNLSKRRAKIMEEMDLQLNELKPKLTETDE